MWLIVGLGNPGLKYKRTRHNIGFLVVDELASRGGMNLRRKKMEALYGSGCLGRKEVTLIKPQAFMNRSGFAVAAWLRTLKLNPSQLIVIHDDLDLLPFQLRVRKGGSHGGHRGILSIIQELGTRNFIRIRVGIGRPAECNSSVDHVLQSFSTPEKQYLPQAIKKAADAVLVVLELGLEAAMNRFNARNKRESKAAAGISEEERNGEMQWEEVRVI